MDLQRILLIILVLFVLGGGYYYFQVYNVTPSAEGGSPVVAQLDARLNDIRPLAAVQIDASIFSNPFFRSLQVITASSTNVTTPGRVNPFVPY